MTNIDPLDTDTGFLVKRMRKYLRDPEGFEEENGEKEATDIRYRIRKAKQAADEQRRFLEENRGDWDLRKTGQDLEYQPSVDDERSVQLHEPFPDEDAMAFAIHEDTHQILEEIQTRLSQMAVDYFLNELDTDQIPGEFDSKGAYRDYLQDNRQGLRTMLDKKWSPTHEVFVGDDFVTVDDVIRLVLGLLRSAEELEEAEDEDATYLGRHAEFRNDIVRALFKKLNDNRSSLYRARSERSIEDSETDNQ